MPARQAPFEAGVPAPHACCRSETNPGDAASHDHRRNALSYEPRVSPSGSESMPRWFAAAHGTLVETVGAKLL